MKFTKKILFEIESEGIAIKFVPTEGRVPGFSYRVYITQLGKLVDRDWLEEGRNPTQKTAEYYVQKHIIAPNPAGK